MSERSVIVVGGGLAGLAAAVQLVGKGYRVTLLESRPRLGGRAASITDTTTGSLIDNCQHVSMGCCVNFQRFCVLTETSPLFTVEQQLQFIARDSKVNVMRNSVLPAPAQLGWSFAKLSYLSWADKLSLSRALLNLVRAKPPASGRFLDWLNTQQQSPVLRERFWNIVLVSALSESLDRIDFHHARKVFLDGFLQHRESWKIHLLTIPLGEFYDQHVGVWLKNRGATIHCQTGIAQFVMRSVDDPSEQIAGVQLRDGSILQADDYVLAVPFDRAAQLLPAVVTRDPAFSQLTELETAPITSVHFWLDRPITSLRHAVLIDRLSQWMFNRSEILQSESAGDSPLSGYAYQVVISNSRELKQQIHAGETGSSQQQLIHTVWQELQEIWPAGRQAQILHARVLTEHRAVFSVTPGVESLRPPQQTPLTNLQVAGDYTQTGWPATMEGAVRSGFLAAENLLKQQGQLAQDATLLSQELPGNMLLKWLNPS